MPSAGANEGKWRNVTKLVMLRWNECMKTAKAKELRARFEIVTWWAAEVEVWSGLCRARRSRGLSQVRSLSAQRVAREPTEHRHPVHQNGALTALACSLLEAHTLSAAAALHIAAALRFAKTGRPDLSLSLPIGARQRQRAAPASRLNFCKRYCGCHFRNGCTEPNYTENDEPQPQEREEFGLIKLKPCRISVAS